ncbi:hypothetical protein RCL_jg24202.t1 [Rhizophagus clarus]|uniref:Uncharacterized protein n=1 Tax=Rhizophagus clarus TaxID=94130 RepID=A0A8H3LFG7_9GLOM|nr:hypothetical protein RCL_jg24202.t1 [Rhizophagus clarus]
MKLTTVPDTWVPFIHNIYYNSLISKEKTFFYLSSFFAVQSFLKIDYQLLKEKLAVKYVIIKRCLPVAKIFIVSMRITRVQDRVILFKEKKKSGPCEGLSIIILQKRTRYYPRYSPKNAVENNVVEFRLRQSLGRGQGIRQKRLDSLLRRGLTKAE